MDTLLTMIFLSVPLIIICYVIFNARQFSWMSYILILVVTMISIAVFIPMMNVMVSDTNTSGNISKTFDDIASSEAMNGFLTLVFPMILLIGATAFILWLVSGLFKKFSSLEYIRERDEKKKRMTKPTLLNISMKKIPNDKQKDKSKEVITSGWSNKK